jgi:hypothetical protein
MALAAELSSIGGIRTGVLPPKTARIEQLSTTARDQSIWLKRQSQSNSAKWINCQVPDSCQSRRSWPIRRSCAARRRHTRIRHRRSGEGETVFHTRFGGIAGALLGHCLPSNTRYGKCPHGHVERLRPFLLSRMPCCRSRTYRRVLWDNEARWSAVSRDDEGSQRSEQCSSRGPY